MLIVCNNSSPIVFYPLCTQKKIVNHGFPINNYTTRKCLWKRWRFHYHMGPKQSISFMLYWIKNISKILFCCNYIKFNKALASIGARKCIRIYPLDWHSPQFE